jgi:hypothetical protein
VKGFKARTVRVAILTAAILGLTPFARAQSTGCSSVTTVEEIIDQLLPGLALLPPQGDGTCPQIVAADFNRDSTIDFAAVLRERVAPRKTPQGDDWFNGYVVLFLSTALPYSSYFAAFVPGHATSYPARLALAVREGDQLEVTVLRYSRTIYKWGPSGLSLVKHEAD